MISQIYFQSGENTNVSSFFGTKPQRLGLFFIFLQYNHSLLAYQMRKALFLFLWIFTVQTIGAQDLTEKKFPLTTSVKTVNVGNIRVLDPYLSPFEYSGFLVGYKEDNRRFLFSSDTTLSFTSRKILNVGSADHPNKNNSMLMFNGNYNLGLNYHIRPADKLMILIGGSWDIDLGGKYIGRNVNNPFSLDLYTNINVAAEIQYSFNIRRQHFRLLYGAQTPLIGCMFVPMQGASYYELFSLSNLTDAIHLSSLVNNRAVMQYFHLDLPLKYTTFRFGVQHDYMQYAANDMVFHKKGLSFSIGYLVDLYSFPGKKIKMPGNFISAYK